MRSIGTTRCGYSLADFLRGVVNKAGWERFDFDEGRPYWANELLGLHSWDDPFSHGSNKCDPWEESDRESVVSVSSSGEDCGQKSLLESSLLASSLRGVFLLVLAVRKLPNSMLPRRPKMPKIAPRRPQDGPRTTPRRPWTAQQDPGQSPIACSTLPPLPVVASLSPRCVCLSSAPAPRPLRTWCFARPSSAFLLRLIPMRRDMGHSARGVYSVTE